MASEIVFASGASVKVTAQLNEVREALVAGTELDTQRFAGFRGDEAVGAERIVLSGGAIAYAIEIHGP